MLRRASRRFLALSVFLLFPAICVSQSTNVGPRPIPGGPKWISHQERASPLDLEVSGALTGFPPGTKRYLRREELLALPQVSFAVSDDPNFAVPVQVRGVELKLLAGRLAADGESALVVAICDDWYRAHYSPAYISAHGPVLALEINEQPPSGWPKSKDGSGLSMGPYLITHPHFTPSLKVLAQQEEAQNPWGVVRLEFRNETTALSAIAPRGAAATDPAVQAGYQIARQNCWRCHGPEDEEPLKGKLTWAGIALFASQAPKNFAAYVRNPQAQARDAQMPGNPGYDDATLQALVSYFKTFAAPVKR